MTYDLLSLRIPLLLAPGQDLNNRPIPKWWGEAAHQLAIKVIASQDAALAVELEDKKNKKMKPFTVSNLRGRFLHGGLNPESIYQLRFTALNGRIAEIFKMSQKTGMLSVGSEIELDFIKFRIPELAPEDKLSVEVRETSFETLKNTLLLSPQPPRELTLRFTSPTLFKHGPRHNSFPIPELIFGNLIEHWNDVYPEIPLSNEAKKYADQNIIVNRCVLESRVAMMYGEPFRGFTGKVTMFALHYDRYLMGIISMLAQFATFSGVGAKTTMGLGQCSLLPETTIINQN